MYLSIGLNDLRVSMVNRTFINRYNLEFKNDSYLEQKRKFLNKTPIFKDKLNNSSAIIPGLPMKFQIPRSRVNSELIIGDKYAKISGFIIVSARACNKFISQLQNKKLEAVSDLNLNITGSFCSVLLALHSSWVARECSRGKDAGRRDENARVEGSQDRSKTAIGAVP